MPTFTTWIGVLLIGLSLGSYALTGTHSVTAFIPAFFGGALVALGLLARRPSLRKHVMHAAASVTLLGLLGSAMGIPKLFRLLGGAEVARPSAVIAQSIMFVLCAVLLGACIASFVRARRQPKTAEHAPPGSAARAR